jgi:organic hydroperoxide reductase OsmC/OhrA
MAKEHFYQVLIKWKEGRIGELSSPVLDKTIECVTPPEFPNGVPGIWSPEHLFAAAINSCYMATFLAIAENYKVEIASFECHTIAKLEMVEGRFLITSAEVSPVATLSHSDEDTEKALRIMEKAKAGCLVTNSIKTEIILKPIIS